VGIYFDIKSSSDVTREIQRATDASDVYAQQLAQTKPANILEVAVKARRFCNFLQEETALIAP